MALTGRVATCQQYENIFLCTLNIVYTGTVKRCLIFSEIIFQVPAKLSSPYFFHGAFCSIVYMV